MGWEVGEGGGWRESGGGVGEWGSREWGGLRDTTTSSRNPRVEPILKRPYLYSRFLFFVRVSPVGDIGGWFSISGVDSVRVWDETHFQTMENGGNRGGRRGRKGREAKSEKRGMEEGRKGIGNRE